MRLCLLPSPLTPPAVVAPLGAALEGRGHEVAVARGAGVDTAQVLDGFLRAAAGADVVVPHSNAGRFGPEVAERAGAELVCLDSLLPGRPPSPAQVGFLRSHEQPDGLLAPWSTWWPEEDLRQTVGPHQDVLTAAEPRVPLRLLLDDPPAPEGWLARRAGYVAFGDTYDEERTLVERHGWVVRRLDGRHLHLLSAPGEVADTVLEVVSQLG